MIIALQCTNLKTQGHIFWGKRKTLFCPMGGDSTKKIVSAASARAHTRKSSIKKLQIKSSSNMIAQITVGLLAALLGGVYLAIKAPSPKTCGSLGGPPIISPRVKLDDGRHLSYKERGVAKEARHKIIVVHGFDDSKDLYLPISEELLKELQIYLLSFDRAGYGESDPNSARTVKSEAFDIQELADKLQLGPKFFVIGISMGAYPIWSCLKYIPNRLAGAALVVPFVNYWWPRLPPNIAEQTFKKLLLQDQWTFRVAKYAPRLFHWWMTQKLFPSLSILEGRTEILCSSDLEIIQKLSPTAKESQEKIRQQGVYESLHRDIIAGYGKWEFDPLDLSNPFPNNESSVHIWQGYEDKFIPYELNRYLSQQLPWIQYHEVPDAGHLLNYNVTYCEAIFKSLVLSSS